MIDPDPDPADAELLRAHVAGDRGAFRELVARHQRLLWGIALRLLGSPEDAADAVQTALIQAYRRAPGYRGDASVRTWLCAIVRNACRDRQRQSRARPVPAAGPEALDRMPVPRDPIADHELRLDLLRALRRLPYDQREVVVLVDLHGFGVGEVARLLGLPTGTVKSRAARARLRLRALLTPAAPDPALSTPEHR